MKRFAATTAAVPRLLLLTLSLSKTLSDAEEPSRNAERHPATSRQLGFRPHRKLAPSKALVTYMFLVLICQLPIAPHRSSVASPLYIFLFFYFFIPLLQSCNRKSQSQPQSFDCFLRTQSMSHFGRAGPPDIRDTYSLLVLNITFRTWLFSFLRTQFFIAFLWIEIAPL